MMRFDAAKARAIRQFGSGGVPLGSGFAASGLIAAATAPAGQTQATGLVGLAAACANMTGEVLPFATSSLPVQLGVATGVSLFWRGAWYILDGILYPEDILASGASSLALGAGGLATLQHAVAPRILQAVNSGKRLSAASRLATVYGMTMSCVLYWRGAWLLCDAAYEKLTGSVAVEKPLHSGIASHVGALAGLVAAGRLTSALAPPAAPCLFTDTALWCKLKGNASSFIKENTWLFRVAGRRL